MRMHLCRLASECPSVEFVVEPHWNRRPLMRAYYVNGRMIDRQVANMDDPEIMKAFQELRDQSGHPAMPFHQQVKSDTPAVRPIWSPFHNRSLNPLHERPHQHWLTRRSDKKKLIN